MKEKNLGIYLHIPFCKSKCPYCDFYSVVSNKESLKEDFTKAMVREIIGYGKTYGIGGKNLLVDTVYFGGGTPSVLDIKQLRVIMDALQNSFNIEKNSEISMEANPLTLDSDSLKEYKRIGINRLSLGAQSFDENVLKTLGRRHKAQDIFNVVNQGFEVGFDNISIDLMFAIPGQSFSSWMDSVEKAVDTGVKHISLYSLEIMENTFFYKAFMEGRFKETSPEEDRKMYSEALRYFSENGFEQYEISNVAKKGYESRHNLKYWRMAPYLGFGPSAHSYIDDKRFNNYSNLEIYCSSNISDGNAIGCNALGSNISSIEEIYENSIEDTMSEYIFTGLRTREGISKEDFFQRFGKDIWQVYGESKKEWELFCKNGAALEDEYTLKLTLEGMNISNKIMTIFV